MFKTFFLPGFWEAFHIWLGFWEAGLDRKRFLFGVDLRPTGAGEFGIWGILVVCLVWRSLL